MEATPLPVLDLLSLERLAEAATRALLTEEQVVAVLQALHVTGSHYYRTLREFRGVTVDAAPFR